jgi:membrane protein DedA with SNARE-associated domain
VEHILSIVASWITAVIASGGYPGVVALMAIESACIPLPSEVIMPFAGYLVSQDRMNLHAAALAGALGCAVGSVAAYAIGLRGGRPFVEKYGRYVLIRRRDLDRADDWFRRYGDAAIFFSRLLPVVRTFISLPAGIARMPFARFTLLSFLGSVPWCYLLAYIGVIMGEHWRDLKKYFHGADLVIGALIIVAGAWWIWRHLRPETEEKPEPITACADEAEKAGARR